MSSTLRACIHFLFCVWCQIHYFVRSMYTARSSSKYLRYLRYLAHRRRFGAHRVLEKGGRRVSVPLLARRTRSHSASAPLQQAEQALHETPARRWMGQLGSLGAFQPNRTRESPLRVPLGPRLDGPKSVKSEAPGLGSWENLDSHTGKGKKGRSKALSLCLTV